MNRATIRRSLIRERARLEQLKEGLYDELGDPQDQQGLGDLGNSEQHPADAGSERFERDKGLSIIADLDAELGEVKSALHRLQHGSYGTCEICRRPIPEARLQVRPATRFCVQDQQRVERQVRSA
ncbi:MAG TPA: TraR/DksA C4-type zinc finger protein [Actinomycetota bacterium]